MVQTTFLYYLTRVAHYQSLSIAAEELHVSQPDEKENDTLNDLTIYCNPAYSSLVMSALSESNNSEKMSFSFLN